jgi:hypothetical protein
LNASNARAEALRDFERSTYHLLSPESPIGLLAPTPWVHGHFLPALAKKMNASFKGNMSKVKSFVKKILCGGYGLK